MESKKYTGNCYRLELSDGILYVTYIGGPITLEIAKDLVKNRINLTNGKPVPVLVNVIKVKGIDREARDFFSTDDGTDGLKAGAIVTNNVFTRHMANIFMKISFNRSKMPARMFSKESEAVDWLSQFK
jgi:hypothetical protein